MSKISTKVTNLIRRKIRVKSRLFGTSSRPRLTVFVSNRHISAQLIDDENHHTITAVTSVGHKNIPENLSEKAKWVGTEVAKKAKAHKIKSVVFDRNGKLYHGRVKALAEAARQEGLEF